MQIRHRHKELDDARDAREVALQGRGQHKGGNHHCIVIVDMMCININITSNKNNFSGLNSVNLFHIMLVDC